MAKKLETPCAASKRGLTCEMKLDFNKGGYTSFVKGFISAIRERYGAAAALEMYDKVMKMEDRIKNMTITIKNGFQLQGNDAETIGEWFDIYEVHWD